MAQADPGLLGLGVTNDIVEQFPQAAIEHYFQIGVELDRLLPNIFKSDLQGLLLVQLLDEPIDRGLESQFMQHRRAQFRDHRVQVEHDLFHQAGDPGEFRPLGIRERQVFFQRVELEPGQGQHLPDPVVEIGRDLPPFLVFAGGKLDGQRLEPLLVPQQFRAGIFPLRNINQA